MAKSVSLVLIVDESGSMESLRADTIGGVNRFIEDQKAVVGKPAKLTIVCFSTNAVRTAVDSVPIAKVEPWTVADYTPNSGTPLLDAVGDALTNAQGTGIAVIVTDGQENSSHRWSKDAVRRLIADKEAQGWQVLYFGANVDAFDEAGSMGIAMAATMDYAATPDGVFGVYASASSTATSARTEPPDPTP